MYIMDLMNNKTYIFLFIVLLICIYFLIKYQIKITFEQYAERSLLKKHTKQKHTNNKKNIEKEEPLIINEDEIDDISAIDTYIDPVKNNI